MSQDRSASPLEPAAPPSSETVDELINRWRSYQQQPARSLTGEPIDDREIERENKLIDVFIRDLASVRAADAQQIAQLQDLVDGGIVSRGQDAILAELTKLAGVAPGVIDGSGCDSGDPVDLTLSEIRQAFGIVTERAESAEAALAKKIDGLRTFGRHTDRCSRRGGYSYDCTCGLDALLSGER